MSLRNLTDREKRDLRVFKERARELLGELPPEKRQLPSGFSMAWNKDTPGIQFETHFPDSDTLLAFATRARIFFMLKDQIEIGHICNVLHLRLTSDELRIRADELHHYYNRRLQTTGLGVTINDEKKTAREIFVLWLNGKVYHADDDKTQTYNKFGPMEPYPKQIVIDILNTIVVCVIDLFDIVDKALH